MLNSPLNLILNFPEHQLPAKILHQFLCKRIPLSLEIESIVDMNYYCILDTISLESSFLGCIELIDSPVTSEVSKELQNFLSSNNKMLVGNSAIYIDYLFFIIPLKNSNNLGLYRFNFEKLMSNDIENYLRYINDFKKGQDILREMCRSANRELKSLDETMEGLSNFCCKTNFINGKIAVRISHRKKNVCKLFVKNREKEVLLEKNQCTICNGKLRNIVFLPCGHFIICSECLILNYFIIPNFPICNRTLKCARCLEYVQSTIMFSEFNS